MLTTKILVLGASGFIGQQLVSFLSGANGLEVIAASRHPNSSPTQKWRTICVDTLNAAQLSQALEGIDAVVNCVAGDAATIRDGAEILMAACRQQGVTTLVHLSSMAVYGSTIGPVTELTPVCRDGGWYCEAKCDAEISLSKPGTTGCRVVILRPGCVYGPGSDQWVGRIARLLKSQRIGDLGAAGDGLSNLVHVDDVVEAIFNGITNPQSRGIYNLCSPDNPAWNDYFISLAMAMGHTPVKRITSRQLKVDSRFLSIIFKLATIITKKISTESNLIPDPIPPSLLRLWGQNIHLDSSRADQNLVVKWTPLKEGVRSSAAWVKQNRQ